MRKGILGLLACGLAGLAIAHAQQAGAQAESDTSFQEPLPIQTQALPYGAGPYSAYGTPRFPNYASPGYAPAAYPGYMPAAYGAQPMGFSGMGAVPAMAQVPLPTPLQPGGAVDPKAQPFQAPMPIPASPEKGKAADKSSTGLPVETMAMEGGEPAEPYLVTPPGTWKPSKGYNFYGSADYLFWFVKHQTLPANIALSLSDPNFVPQLPYQRDNGGRFFVGAWLNDRQTLALEGGYFFLGTRTSTFAQNLPGSALANRPIFDGINSETTFLAASTTFMGAEANVRYQALHWDFSGTNCPPSRRLTGHLDLLSGFRYADLSENLLLNNNTQFGTAPVLLSNATLATSDLLGTHNHFYGGQIGAEAWLDIGRFDVTAHAKLAFGNTREEVTINGTTQVSGPPALGNFTSVGGFFAQPGNIGSFRHDVFAVLPEVGVNLGFKVCDRCRLAVGYTFVYLSNVARPGDQIDASAGGGTRPPLSFLGGARPQPQFGSFNETGFWAQGINLTLELNY